MKALLFALALSLFTTGYAQKQKPAKQAKQNMQQEAMKVLASGLSQDPRFAWKYQQDEAQIICSQYKKREDMPAQAIQKVIELSSKSFHYPQWGIYMGDWREGKKIVESARGGRFASYGFSDNPNDKGGNCYACHLIEKGQPGGTMGPNLYQYGKRWNITKENLNSPQAIESIKTVYQIIYNSWAMFPCSSMPRFGHNGNLSPEDIANIVAFLLHPDSPVNK